MPNGNNGRCSGYCAPFYIYVVLAVLGTVVQLIAAIQMDKTVNEGAHQLLLIVLHVILAVLWASLIYWFCTKCWYGAAWATLLLPYVFIFLIIILVIVFLAGVARTRGIPQYRTRPARELPNADYWSPVH
jgi:hypothetical protein